MPFPSNVIEGVAAGEFAAEAARDADAAGESANDAGEGAGAADAVGTNEGFIAAGDSALWVELV